MLFISCLIPMDLNTVIFSFTHHPIKSVPQFTSEYSQHIINTICSASVFCKKKKGTHCEAEQIELMMRMTNYLSTQQSHNRKTHHLPPQNLDPLICLHACLSTEVIRPLRKHQAEDTSNKRCTAPAVRTVML